MKPLHLSTITGSEIAIIVTITAILMIVQSANAYASLTIGTDKNVYGVGEPISFFVETKNQSQNVVFPTAVIVDGQNQTVWHDDDLPPNDYKGTTKVYYVQQDSENVPIINQTGKYMLIVTYGGQKASEDLTVTELVKEDNMLHFYGSYKGISNDNGTAEIANQTYYITTVHKTPSDLTGPDDTTIRFYYVSFTFPGCGRCLPVPTVENPAYYVQVQFPDKTNETLAVRANMWSTIGPPMDFHEYFSNGTKIFPNGTKGTWVPRLHKDQIVTVLSNHKNPQAGITVTHDSVKFLASTENNSFQLGPTITITLDPLEQFKSGIASKDVACKKGLDLLIRTEDGSPACVRYTTADLLINRGWAREAVSTMTSLAPTVIIPVNSSLISNGFTFVPAVVKTLIGINNTVRWINMDSDANDITSDTGSFSSGVIEPGYAWMHIFDKAGTYGYHSVIHPWLKGTIIVTANPLASLENDTGTVTFGNQTYYFETPNYTNDAYFHPVQVSFHDVVFTLFPSGFKGGLPTSCGETYYWTDVRFSDNASELLHIFAGPKCPVLPPPTSFSNHANPQAGLTFYDGKMKLLVSTSTANSIGSWK